MRTLNTLKMFAAAAALAAMGQLAQAFEAKTYDDAAFKAAQAQGGEILVHVTAPWCPTCVSQHKTVSELGKKPEFSKVTVFNVDFDSQGAVWKGFKANSQSTLIAFKGATETGRLVGATKADAIESLLKTTMKQ